MSAIKCRHNMKAGVIFVFSTHNALVLSVYYIELIIVYSLIWLCYSSAIRFESKLNGKWLVLNLVSKFSFDVPHCLFHVAIR